MEGMGGRLTGGVMLGARLDVVEAALVIGPVSVDAGVVEAVIDPVPETSELCGAESVDAVLAAVSVLATLVPVADPELALPEADGPQAF